LHHLQHNKNMHGSCGSPCFEMEKSIAATP
jgi:hypothetical protein